MYFGTCLWLAMWLCFMYVQFCIILNKMCVEVLPFELILILVGLVIFAPLMDPDGNHTSGSRWIIKDSRGDQLEYPNEWISSENAKTTGRIEKYWKHWKHVRKLHWKWTSTAGNKMVVKSKSSQINFILGKLKSAKLGRFWFNCCLTSTWETHAFNKIQCISERFNVRSSVSVPLSKFSIDFPEFFFHFFEMIFYDSF